MMKRIRALLLAGSLMAFALLPGCGTMSDGQVAPVTAIVQEQLGMTPAEQCFAARQAMSLALVGTVLLAEDETGVAERALAALEATASLACSG